MAHLPENSNFDEGVRQLELTDPVIGGPNGVSNEPLKNLANRTRWLRDQLKRLEDGTAPASHVGARGTAHAVATASENGFMASTDKSKLDGIQPGAQVNAVRTVAGRTGDVRLEVADINGAAPASSPRLSGMVVIQGDVNGPVLSGNGYFQSEWKTSATTAAQLPDTYVPNMHAIRRLAVTGINGKRGEIGRLEVSDVHGAAPSSNASFSGTTRFSGTVDLSSSGEVRGKNLPEGDDSAGLATTGWIRRAMGDIARRAGLELSHTPGVTPHHGENNGIEYSDGWGGYFKMPSWLGGFVINWLFCYRNGRNGGFRDVKWKKAFSECYSVSVTPWASLDCRTGAHALNEMVRVGCHGATDLKVPIYVVAIGRA